MFARIVTVVGAVLCACTVFADTGSVVFGSWLSSDYAEAALAAVQRDLAVTARVVAADVDGTRYHRVTSETLPEATARSLIDRAGLLGYRAWFLRSQGTTSPARVATRRAPVAAGNAQTGDGKRPAAADATAGSQAADAPDSDTASAAPQPAAAPAVERQPRTDDPQPAPSLKLQPRRSGEAGPAIEIPHFSDATIRLDGRTDDAIWRDVPAHDNMLVTEPDTGAAPAYATITRFLYTDRGLYVGVDMEQPAETLIERLSSRDQYINRDAFGITIDPSGTGLYGYWFEVNLGDSVMDGKVVPERAFSEQWDGPWRGASSRTEGGWSVEIFLPWSMMAMPQDQADRKVGFWLKRRVAHLDETYSWPALPFTGQRFMSALQTMTVPGIEPKQQFAIFPYASMTRDEIIGDDDYEMGFDFSYRPSSNLQVTGTLNPDFGAVESDDVVVNLTAFETYFPEKRLFFLEGNEVFITSPRSDVNRFNATPQGTGARATPPTFSSEPTTMLNTRRIGGAATHIDIPDGIDVDDVEQSKPTDLLGAVKLVGQAGQLRYGVLAAFEDDVELRGTDEATGASTRVKGDGREFGVVRALWEQSGSGRGRKAFGYMGTLVTLPDDDASVHGLDAHYLSPNGRWIYDAQYLNSNVDSETGHGFYSDLTWVQSRQWLHRMALDYLDEKLDISDLGFIRRNDIIAARYGIVRTRSRDLERFRRIRNSLFFSTQWNTDGFGNRFGIFTNQTFMFQNRSEVKFTLNYFPERWDDRNSRGNGDFKVEDRWFSQIAFGSDTARRLSWSGTVTVEQEELGDWTYGSDFGFTYKPSGRLSLNMDIRYKRRDGWLVYRTGRDFTTYSATDWQPAVEFDYFFTARHQLRMTLQWAGIRADDQDYYSVPLTDGDLIDRDAQDGSEDFTLSRITAQLRYRWEIGPLSDLFVVYTRGSNLPSQVGSPFGELFRDSLDEPIVETFVVKLRYRFGT